MFNILALFNFPDVGKMIEQAIRTLFGRIAALLYDFIVIEYDLFVTISRAEILDNALVQRIYEKVGWILGIFMIFKLSFSLLQHMIEPAKFTDQNNGFASLVKRFIISIVLLGTVPSVFRFAFDIQNYVVGSNNSNNNIIYKLIIGDSISTNVRTFGNKLSADLFFTFFTESKEGILNEGTYVTDDGLKEKNFKTLKRGIESGEFGFSKTVRYLSLVDTGNGDSYIIDFRELESVIVAIAVIYLLLVYTIQVSIRVIQLAYLQVVAPIPILSYISDPKGSFEKWIKQCISTYLDLFIRVAIIYFIVYLCDSVFNAFNNSSSILNASLGNISSTLKDFVKVFLVIGMLLFAKKAPELLKDLFPSMGTGSGKFDFGLKSGFLKGAATFGVGAAAGAVGGLATGVKYGDGFKGKVAGVFSGVTRGTLGGMKFKGNPFKNAGKGMSAQRSAALKAYERHHDGSTLFGRTALGSLSASRDLEIFDKELSSYDQFNNIASLLEKELSKNSMVQAAVAHKQALLERESRGGAAATFAEIDKADAAIKEANKRALAAAIYDFGSTRENKTIKSILHSAEATRAKGQSKGYSGFGNVSFEDTSLSSRDRADAFFDNKTSTTVEQNNIKNPGGSRNGDYKKAKANAKYNEKK